MQLTAMRVVLTGASGGIGSALARQLVQGGAQVMLVGRNAEQLEKLQKELGDSTRVFCADITLADAREALSAAAGDFAANVLVNNAGVSEFRLFEDSDDEVIDRVLQLNVASTLKLTRKLLPQLTACSRAIVLNVGSTLGSIGMPGYTVYCSSKFALRGFTEALAREYADHPALSICYVAPRATNTAINSEQVVAMNRELGNAMDDADAVAKDIVALMLSGAASRYLGWPEKLFVRINALFPALVNNAFVKQLPVIRRYARQH